MRTPTYTWKVSAYNVCTRDQNGCVLFANTLTGAVVRFSALIDQSLLQALLNPNENIQLFRDHPTTAMLVDNGFVIPDDVEEFQILQQRWEHSRNGTKALGLAILPTLSCNFRCTYCYEEHGLVDMPASVQESVLAYVDKNLPGREALRVVWFGGEPLIRMRILKEMSERFIGLSKVHGAQYLAAAVTNGYLLSRQMIESLKSIMVTKLQVTVDGSQPDHDKRRILVNGGPTYDRIVSNLLTCAGEFREVIIRINIDKRNCGGIQGILTDLDPIKQHIVLALRPTSPPSGDSDNEPWALKPPEWRILHRDFAEMAYKRGFSLGQGYPLPGTPFCSAYQLNSITVDPSGDVHRCPVFVGKKDFKLGTLTPEGEIVLAGGLQKEWATSNPFTDPSCANCKVLPICMGGCPWHRNKGKSSFRCFAYEDTVTGLLSDFFLQQARPRG